MVGLGAVFVIIQTNTDTGVVNQQKRKVRQHSRTSFTETLNLMPHLWPSICSLGRMRPSKVEVNDEHNDLLEKQPLIISKACSHQFDQSGYRVN